MCVFVFVWLFLLMWSLCLSIELHFDLLINGCQSVWIWSGLVWKILDVLWGWSNSVVCILEYLYCLFVLWLFFPNLTLVHKIWVYLYFQTRHLWMNFELTCVWYLKLFWFLGGICHNALPLCLITPFYKRTKFWRVV